MTPETGLAAADDLPAPWCPPTPVTDALHGARGDDDDVAAVEPRVLGPRRGEAPEPWLASLAERVLGLAGLPAVELEVAREADDRRGFCGGRVWLSATDAAPLRVRLRPCPNSDRAEVAATLVHELAHAVVGRGGHGATFKAELLGLAGRAWGAAYFGSASAADPYPAVDRWVASGIRAALDGRAAPTRKTGDAGDTARVVARIRKLRALAADQLGRPEAVSATGRANDLVTMYGLGDYAVEIAAGIDEQLVDRWVRVAARQVWQRHLAHVVGDFFGVFTLGLAAEARMHFFGRYADVVAAAYLFEVCVGQLERACERHLDAWRRAAHRPRGASRRERVAFLDNAVIAFRRKLADQRPPETAAVIDRAEDFAWVEHRKRGMAWRRGRTRRVARNEAGAQAGAALDVVRGVGGRAQPQLER